MSTCEGRVLGSAIKALPLRTIIGNPKVEDLVTVWDPWPNNYFGLVDFGDEENIEIEADDGDLFFTPLFGVENVQVGTPRYRSTIWVDTGEESDIPQVWYNFEGSALYFRWLPSRNPDDSLGGFADDWIGTFQAYDFDTTFVYILIEIAGSGLGAGQPSIYMEIADDLTFYDAEIAYDPDVHRWFRIAHDESTGVITISTASTGCDTWTERLSTGVAVVEPFDTMTIELTNTVDYTADSPANPGYFGAFNERPRQRVLPLYTTIGEPKQLGSALAVLPLLTTIGDPSTSS
jgi:hypothetical protein